ncbi:gag-pol fusion poly [Labeo rohita]|uniref:Gag-pol fusion poly n=1 Tax=Labeo rohita TaxID=84645 RepID=A0A498M1X8_LABRO|nr:gag-pol fusion poly [Labeo rohita]RXN36468.1 gag-pol fusion poly [Labeo rohita]
MISSVSWRIFLEAKLLSAIEIVEELQWLPAVRGHQPKSSLVLQLLPVASLTGGDGKVVVLLVSQDVEAPIVETASQHDSEEEELGEYAITRVNIGDKPASCIAQLAMPESANLPQFVHFREEHRVLYEDSYVDEILTSHNSLDHLKIITVNVEQILKAGGFELKTLVFSGQCRRNESAGKQEEEVTPKAVVLPNQLQDEDNKALGLGYTVEDDKFHIMFGINFSKRKKKIRLGQDLLLGQVRAQMPDPLTRRELISKVSSLYDPISLATPIKQRGAILV